MRSMTCIAPVAVLGLLAGSAAAGIQTSDISLSFSTPSPLAGLTFGLNSGLSGEVMSDAVQTAAVGTIDLRVSIDNGSLVSAELLGGQWSTVGSLSGVIVDGADTTVVNLSPLSVMFGAGGSPFSLGGVTGDAQRDFAFSTTADYAGSISTEENGIQTSLLDLSQLSGLGDPILNGFIEVSGNQITLRSKLRFDGTGLDANLRSGKSFGYFGASDIVATGIVPAPATIMIGSMVMGFASRRRRG